MTAEVNGTAVARAKLDGSRLTGLKVIFRQSPKVDSKYHFGSRLVFARDGNLFVTLGRAELGAARRRTSARISARSCASRRTAAPPDNPFVGREGALPEIWSSGIATCRARRCILRHGRLWTHEHGPRGGDEINMPQAGRNYGWPVITYGREYSGPAIGEGTVKEGMEQPLHYWVPSIGPSGMTFHYGRRVSRAGRGTCLSVPWRPGRLRGSCSMLTAR